MRNRALPKKKPLAKLTVEFTEQAKSAVKKTRRKTTALKSFYSPSARARSRPAYQQDKPSDRIYGMSFVRILISNGNSKLEQ